MLVVFFPCRARCVRVFPRVLLVRGFPLVLCKSSFRQICPNWREEAAGISEPVVWKSALQQSISVGFVSSRLTLLQEVLGHHSCVGIAPLAAEDSDARPLVHRPIEIMSVMRCLFQYLPQFAEVPLALLRHYYHLGFLGRAGVAEGASVAQAAIWGPGSGRHQQ